MVEKTAHDLWQSVADLRQPCLRTTNFASLLADDGCVREEVLRSIDRLLVAYLSEHAQNVAPSEPTLELSADQKWINASALQKAIRRGQASRAVRHALAGVHLDPKHTLRRLAVCALEDIGIGDLAGVAMALAAVSAITGKSINETSIWAAYLAERLSQSPKSRLACDLLSLVDYQASASQSAGGLLYATPSELKQFIVSPDPTAQMLASCNLAGCHVTPAGTAPVGGRKARMPLMRSLVTSRTSLLLYYIADRAAGRLREAMFASVLPIWRSLMHDPELSIARREIACSPDIGCFATEAFDLHTRSGKLALRRLARECIPVRQLVSHLPCGRAGKAVEYAVFIVEGGLLDWEVSYPFAAQVSGEAHHWELAYAGAANHGMQEALLSVVRENLVMLHELRRCSVRSN